VDIGTFTLLKETHKFLIISGGSLSATYGKPGDLYCEKSSDRLTVTHVKNVHHQWEDIRKHTGTVHHPVLKCRCLLLSPPAWEGPSASRNRKWRQINSRGGQGSGVGVGINGNDMKSGKSKNKPFSNQNDLITQIFPMKTAESAKKLH